MKINENNKFQLIEDYLKGGMNQDEVDRFNAFMQSDKDLALDTAISAELEEAASFGAVESQLRDTLSRIRKDKVTVEAPLQEKPRNFTRLIVVALLLAGLSAAFLYVFNNLNSNMEGRPDNPQFAMVEPLALTSKSDEGSTNLVDMEAYYNAGEYEKALPLINEYLKTNKYDLDVLLAKGISLTETSKFKEAHLVFAIIGGHNPRVKKHLWFDAIAYMQEGKTAQASQILRTIIKNESYNHEHAQNLLKRIG